MAPVSFDDFKQKIRAVEAIVPPHLTARRGLGFDPWLGQGGPSVWSMF